MKFTSKKKSRSHLVINVSAGLPTEFQLEQNEPNPFRGRTIIRFAIAKPGWAKLLVLDRDQELVCLLYNGEAAPGRYNVIWFGETDDGQRAPQGSYQYRLEAKGFVATRKFEIRGK